MHTITSPAKVHRKPTATRARLRRCVLLRDVACTTAAVSRVVSAECSSITSACVRSAASAALPATVTDELNSARSVSGYTECASAEARVTLLLKRSDDVAVAGVAPAVQHKL